MDVDFNICFEFPIVLKFAIMSVDRSMFGFGKKIQYIQYIAMQLLQILITRRKKTIKLAV